MLRSLSAKRKCVCNRVTGADAPGERKRRGRRMILLTIRDGDDLRLGVKTPRGVIDVAAAQAALGQGNGGVPETVEAVIAGGEPARSALADLVARAEAADGGGSTWLRDEASLTLGPAVPNPGKIVCVGLNYRKHAEESGAAIPDHAGALLQVHEHARRAGRGRAADRRGDRSTTTRSSWPWSWATTAKNVSAGRCPEHGLRLRDGERPQRARLADADQPVAARQDDGQVHAHRPVSGHRR